jgi:hypothetical protein
MWSHNLTLLSILGHDCHNTGPDKRKYCANRIFTLDHVAVGLYDIWCVAFICTYLSRYVLIFILKSSFQLHLGFFSALFLFTALLWSYFRYMEYMEQLGPSRAHQELRFETFTSLHLPSGPQVFACDPQGQIWKLQTLQGLFLSRFELTQEKRTWPLLGVSLHGFREISRRKDHLQGRIADFGFFWFFWLWTHSFTLFSCCLLLCVSSKLYLRVREQIVCHGCWL